MWLSDLVIKKRPGTSTKWTLTKPLRYNYQGEVLTVPWGFETDLSTNWIRGRHDRSSVLHDWILQQGHTFKYANAVMRQAMKDSNVGPISYFFISTAIGIYGYFKDLKR